MESCTDKVPEYIKSHVNDFLAIFFTLSAIFLVGFFTNLAICCTERRRRQKEDRYVTRPYQPLQEDARAPHQNQNYPYNNVDQENSLNDSKTKKREFF